MQLVNANPTNNFCFLVNEKTSNENEIKTIRQKRNDINTKRLPYQSFLLNTSFNSDLFSFNGDVTIGVASSIALKASSFTMIS